MPQLPLDYWNPRIENEPRRDRGYFARAGTGCHNASAILVFFTLSHEVRHEAVVVGPSVPALVVLMLIGVGAPCGAAEPTVEPKHNQLTAEELADGWILLFDGETMFGWQPNSKANWQVSDGVLSVSEGEPGLLNTTSPWGDFTSEVRLPPAREDQQRRFSSRTAAEPKRSKSARANTSSSAPRVRIRNRRRIT